jgi:hypothetical protein
MCCGLMSITEMGMEAIISMVSMVSTGDFVG